MADGISFIQDLAVILLSAAAGGWGARRLGLSPVVGYLFAGLLVGTPEVTFLEVSDPARIQVLSQVGLVLLMFSIGLGIRLKEMRQLGIAPLLATVLGALLMLTLGRFVGGLIGLNGTQSLFFAAMLMVSSSAIIGKLLAETGQMHQRAGQLALSQTLLEDFVAVVMLTLLGSVAAYGQADSGGWERVLSSLGQLGAFVVLFIITGLLLLPRVVRSMVSDSSELLMILTCGLVFGLALVTVLAGYSLALGAFLCGVLVSEIPRSGSIERSFSGMRDVFAAVFFVAVGMSIDLSQTGAAIDLILVGTGLALIGRFLASTVAWMAVCEEPPGAVRAALFLTPIGEFSFIIAGLGVGSGVLSPRFQIAAVGIAFLTSLAGPMGARYSGHVAAGVSGRHFRLVRDAWGLYRQFWDAVSRRGGSNLLWKLLRPRLWQIGREILWITAVLLFARPLYTYLQQQWDGLIEGWPDWLGALLPWYWFGILLLVIAPLIALLRNLNALCLMVADYLSMQSGALRHLSRASLGLLRTLVYGVAAIWLVNLMPWALIDARVVVALAVLTLLVMLVGWRHFVHWHRQMEMELDEVFADPVAAGAEQPGWQHWEEARQSWGVRLEQTQLPDHFAGAGHTIGELRLRERTGASVAGVERRGWALNQPGPQTHLFPGDEVFLIGSSEQIAAAVRLLGEEQEQAEQEGQLRRAILQSTSVPEDSPLLGRRLQELNWPRLHAVQVAGVRRDGREVVSPGGGWALQAGDELLLMGAEHALRQVRRSLSPEPPTPEPAKAADGPPA